MNQPLLHPKRALLLVNRHARHGQQRLSEAIRQLEELGFILIEESTPEPQQLPELIRRYQNQVDLVIIGGGDGTLNAAVEGLVDTQLPLGILPLGTANDLARTLGIPSAISEACQIIATGQLHRIDLGWVNGKYFFNVASCGLSVQITERLSKEAKRRWGVLAYGATALQVIWQARPFRAEIAFNNESIRVRTVQIAVGNGRYYGGGMTVVHDAAIDDRRLDLYSLEIGQWWQILALLPALWQGRHTALPGVRTINGREIDVYTLKPRAINTDGELTTYTPAKFRVIPQALSVLVP
ncbi:MAG TPA: lipid kinase [Cyanobacteria bacterium UBA11162]|nr:lipid kinase [Cyanobacteria bacterium UBA11162]